MQVQLMRMCLQQRLVLIPGVGLGTAETTPTHKAMTTNKLITDRQSLAQHYDTV